MNSFYDEGYRAFLQGKQLGDNPYHNCGCWAKYNQWELGWKDARDEQNGERETEAGTT